MKKRLTVWLPVLLAVALGLALAVPASRYVLIGWLRNESFYHRRPTSYWVAVLKQDPFVGGQRPAGGVATFLAEGGPAAVPEAPDWFRLWRRGES